MTGHPPSPLASPEATDLLTWEREHSNKHEVIHTNCEEEASATSSTEELTRAVAAKLRKPKKKSTADNDNVDDEEQKRRVSFKTLSKLEKRRALWEAKTTLDQGTSSICDSTVLSGYTGITEGTAATTSNKKSGGCHTHMCFTGYDNTHDEEAASITSDNTYDEMTVASYSTRGSTTINTSDIQQMERIAKSLGNKSLDMEDIDEEEYLNKMGLGVCRLETAFQTCCPWMLCGNSGGPEVISEEEDENEKDNVIDKKNRKLKNAILFEREISDTSCDETNKSKSSAESKSNVRSEAEVTAATAMDAKTPEAVIEHNWTLCGSGELQEEDEDNSIDWEETIDWNNGGAKNSTSCAKKDEVPAAVGVPTAVDVEKPPERQDDVVVVTEDSKSLPVPKSLSVRERLVQKMRKIGGVDDLEGAKDPQDDEVAAGGVTRDLKQTESASVQTEPASIQTETASVSSKTRTVTPTPSKAPPSTTPAVSTPLRAIILPDEPSTPTFLVAPYNKDYSDSDEEGFNQGIDARQPPSIPSTPLKAEVPSMIPLPSTPNTSTLSSAKQKFARAMMKLKKDSGSKNTEEETSETNVSAAAKNQFPSIPSTPLKSDIPSTPLPESNPPTPLAAAAIGATVVSAAAVSAKQKLTRAMMKLKKDECQEENQKDQSIGLLTEENESATSKADNTATALSESNDSTPLTAAAIGVATVSAAMSATPQEAALDEGIEVDEALQPPAIPSTPLKAVIPTVALPNSPQTTPLVNNTTGANLNIKQKLARAIKLRNKPEESTAVVEVNVEKPAKNVGAEVVFTNEAKAPSTIMSRAQSRRVGEEVIFTRASGDEDAPSSTPSSPSNLEPGEVINATDLLESSPSSSFGIRALSRVMKRSLTNRDTDKTKEADADEDNNQGRVVPALPDGTTTVQRDIEPDQTKEDKTASADLARFTPTSPMMRLTNAISFHSQTSARSQADTADVLPPAIDKNEKNVQSASAADSSSAPSNSLDKTTGANSASAFSMIGVLANAMSFVGTDENKKGGNDSKASPLAQEKEETRDVDPAASINRNRESPSILAKAMSFVSTDDNNAMTNFCGVDTTGDDINEPPLEVAQTPSSEVNTPFDVTRETSIATARISNKSPVFMDLKKKSAPNLIEPIAEETNDNQSECKPPKQMSIGSKSRRIFNKVKSCSLVRAAANGSRSQKSVPSVTRSLDSFATSDSTQKVDNSSPKKSQKKRAVEPSNENNVERNATENKSDASNKENMTKKPVSKFALLLKSRSSKKKDAQPDDISTCTGNVTTDSEENASAISSPSRSVVGERSMNESDKQCNAKMEPKKDEVSGSSANVLATASEEKATKPKKKKKKKKGKNGWREYTCPNSGDKYYSNGTITTWDKPAEFDDVDGGEVIKSQVEKDSDKRVTMISFAC